MRDAPYRHREAHVLLENPIYYERHNRTAMIAYRKTTRSIFIGTAGVVKPTRFLSMSISPVAQTHASDLRFKRNRE